LSRDSASETLVNIHFSYGLIVMPLGITMR